MTHSVSIEISYSYLIHIHKNVNVDEKLNGSVCVYRVLTLLSIEIRLKKKMLVLREALKKFIF